MKLPNITVIWSMQIFPVAGLKLMMTNPTGSPRLNFIGFDIPLTGTRVSFMRTSPGLKKLSSDLNDIYVQLEQSLLSHVKKIASIVGQIIFLSASCWNLTQIMIRYLLVVTNSRRSWNSAVFLSELGKGKRVFGPAFKVPLSV